jgi:hypothetical protein
MAARKAVKAKGKRTRSRRPNVQKLLDDVYDFSYDNDPDDTTEIQAAVDELTGEDFADDDDIESSLEIIERGMARQIEELEEQLVKARKVEAAFNKYRDDISRHFEMELVECPHCGKKFNKNSM